MISKENKDQVKSKEKYLSSVYHRLLMIMKNILKLLIFLNCSVLSIKTKNSKKGKPKKVNIIKNNLVITIEAA